jgi:glycerol-3-phosphate dehydrogenase
MPGGDFPVDGVPAQVSALRARYPFLDEPWALRLVRAYGTEAPAVLGTARTAADLGQRFGWNLTESEVRWMMREEWARTAEDVLWRRTKLGLRLSADEAAALDRWMQDHRREVTGSAAA